MRRLYLDIFLVALGNQIQTRGSSTSEILIFGWVLACIRSGVNKVTVDFGADINNELSCRKQDISVK